MRIQRIILIAALLVLLGGAATLAQTTYYVQSDSSSNVGADGTCNLTSGNSTSQTDYQWKSTLTTTAPAGTQTQMRTAVSATGAFFSMGRVYRSSNYAQAMLIAANPTGQAYLRSTSTSDQFQFYVKDYDPSGAAGNGTIIAQTAAINSPSTSAATLATFTFTGSAYIIPAGHRLMLEVMFKPATGGNSARLYCNISTTQTYVTVTETVAITTTVGNGTNPGAAGLCPGGSATMLDAFTLIASSGTDTVTAATVTFAAGTAASLSLVEITDDAGSTVYGSAANPASDIVAISLGAGIGVTTSSTQYKVRVTPKSHAAMPVPPGSAYSVTGTVTAITCTNTKVYSDTSSATVTIDNLSPGNPSGFVYAGGDTQATVSWTNPADSDFAEVLVLRKAGSAITDTPAEGSTYSVPGTIGSSTIIYAGTSQTFLDAGLTNGTSYYYKIFARDTCVNWSTGSAAGPVTPGPVAITPGTPTAVANGCNQVTVSAPYTGDSNANATATFARGISPSGPFSSTVCTSVGGGANPRICVDSSASASSTYYYQVTWSDSDNSPQPGPVVSGSVTTPACTAAPATTVGIPTAAASSCSLLTVTCAFTGDDNANGSTKVEYNTTNSWPGTTACATLSGASPRICTIPGLTAGASYYVRVTFTDADGVTGTNPQVVGPTVLPSCGSDTVPPTVFFLSPAGNAVIGGMETVKAQVYDAGGMAASNPVQWTTDAGSYSSTGVAINSNYACDDPLGPAGMCKVYQFALNTGALSNGLHAIQVKATDAAGNVTTASLPVTVNNTAAATASAGNGLLLRRTPGSQMCLDCHNLQTHSSQYTSTHYGSWALDCLDCHTPHRTTNIKLIRNTITTPNSGAKSIVFQTDDASGGTNPQNSYLGSYDGAGSPYDDGVCEACHTRTSHYRNDTSGGDHTHNQTKRCVGCHGHANGFGATESGGCTVDPVNFAHCSDCHNATWAMMTNASKTTKHLLGSTVGTNDSCTDSGLTWGGAFYTAGTATFTNGSDAVTGSGTAWDSSMVGWLMRNSATGKFYQVLSVASGTSLTLTANYAEANASGAAYGLAPQLSANAAAVRSCVNMCHDDHVHNDPATSTSTHEYNTYKDATNTATRAATRAANGTISGYPGGAAGTAKTDFDATATNGGMCTSCHDNPVNTAHPVLVKGGYAAGAHNITTTTPGGAWTYTLHDGSLFVRNCTKCHAAPAEGTSPNFGGTGITAVHGSDNPSLLAGKVNPAGTGTSLVCYNCHGDGTNGKDYSSRNLWAAFHKTAGTGSAASTHPVDSDAVHDTSAESYAAYSTSGNVFSTSRHVNCLDCHEPHMAGNTLHTAGGATGNAMGAASPLLGVSGVAFTAPATNWAVPGSANYTWVPAATGASKEYQICYKCHSSFAWGTGTPPNSASANGTVTTPVETDVAQEFSPANKSGHPVVDTLNNYTNSTAVGSPTHKGLAAVQLLAPWNTNPGANTMTCSDCHGNDSALPAAQGPHGSAYRFILKGTSGQVYWPANSAGTVYTVASTTASTRAGLFCLNCHPDQRISASSNNMHTLVTNQHTSATYTNCTSCHIVIPHGGKVSRLIGTNTAGLPARYAYSGTASNFIWLAFVKADRASYGSSNFKTSCSHHSSGAASGEAW